MKNIKGFTILEVVISLGILSVGAVAVISLMNSYTKQIRNTEVKSGFESAVSQSLSDASQMITNTPDATGKLVNGLCSFVNTRNTTPGLGYIYLELPKDDPFISQTWGWQSKFKDTEWTSYNCLSTTDSKGNTVPSFKPIPHVWQRCFNPLTLDSNPPYGLPVGLEGQKPIFRMIVTPIRVRVEGKLDPVTKKPLTSDAYKGYQALTLPQAYANRLDARDAAFLVTSEVSFLQNPTDSTRVYSRQSVIHWFGEFQCHKYITTTKTYLTLRPSGFGSGDDNASLFSASETSDQTVFDAFNQTNIFTEGVVKQERAITKLERENLAVAACVEKPNFSCRFKNKTNDSWKDDSLKALLSIRYNSNNARTLNSTLFATPSLSLAALSNGGGAGDAIPLNTTFKVGSTDVSKGYNFTSTKVSLESNVTAPGAACTRVCSSENNFNQTTDPYGLNYTFTDSSNETYEFKDQGSKVGCVCCYGKQCAAIGTKMQSWCGAQPDEALDSRLPECAADYSNPATMVGLKDRSSLKNSPTNKKLSVDVSTANEECLIASKSSDRLSVSKGSCTSKYPVLCYSQGRFVLTKKTYTRADAHQACYDLSTESVLASEIDERMITQMGADNWTEWKTHIMPPLTKDRYVFKNAAMAGLFIAPQEDAQLGRVVASSDVPSSKDFWIALRTNTKGDIVSSIPLIPGTISPFISHFDGLGNLVFLREDNVCDPNYPEYCVPFTGSTEGPVVLHHARTRFGAAVVNPSVTGEFAALCFNPTNGTYVRSSTKTKNYKDSFSLCMKQKAIFLGPARPLQWVASLLVAKEASPLHPFPIYGDKETLSDGTLWTGVESKGGVYSQILPDKPDSCLFDQTLQSVAFDAKTQSPSPASHLERDSNNKLVLKFGEMAEDGKEVWIESEDDLIDISKQILSNDYQTIQYKPCAKPLPGACGSANGVAVATAPTENLCAEGTASSVTGFGPWEWRCQSAGSSPAASCSAPKGDTLTLTQADCKTYTKTFKERETDNKTVSCAPDKKVRCWGTGNGRNWSWKDIENGCQSTEGRANYGSPGCACECTSCTTTSSSSSSP